MATGNVFLDKEIPPPQPTAEMGVKRIVGLFNQQVQSALQTLRQVNQIVAKHGRANLVAAMETNEAAELLAVRKALKDFVAKAAPTFQVDELPD